LDKLIAAIVVGHKKIVNFTFVLLFHRPIPGKIVS